MMFKNAATKPAAPEKTEKLTCAAYGCPIRGTVSIEASRPLCSHHAFAKADKWQHITTKIRDHQWLTDFIGEMRRMQSNNEDWEEYATRFWEASDKVCIPDRREDANAYITRIVAEMSYRCDALTKRPYPRTPMGEAKPAGAFAKGFSL